MTSIDKKRILISKMLECCDKLHALTNELEKEHKKFWLEALTIVEDKGRTKQVPEIYRTLFFITTFSNEIHKKTDEVGLFCKESQKHIETDEDLRGKYRNK